MKSRARFHQHSSSLWSRQLILWDTHFPFAALNVTPFWLGDNLSVFLQIHYEIPSAITELADHLQRHVVISSSLLGKWKQRKRTITMAPQSRRSLSTQLYQLAEGIPRSCLPLWVIVCDSSEKPHISFFSFSSSKQDGNVGKNRISFQDSPVLAFNNIIDLLPWANS